MPRPISEYSILDSDGNKRCTSCRQTLPEDQFIKRDMYVRKDGSTSVQRYRGPCTSCTKSQARFYMKSKAKRELEEFKNMEKLKIMKDPGISEDIKKKEDHILHLESEIKTLQEQLELTLSMINKDARKMFLYMNPKLAKLNFKEQFRPFKVMNVNIGEDLGIYSNKVLVSEELGIPMHKLESVLKGYQVTANGFSFEYVEESDESL